MLAAMGKTTFDRCNCLAVRQAARRVTQLYDTHLGPLGLRATQYSVLSHLRTLGPLSINALAAEMVMDRTTLGRAVRPLQRDGLVSVGPGQDGRTRVLTLSAAGHAKYDVARPAWRAAQDAFETAYGRDAAAEMRGTMHAVVAAMESAP
jgi:DNA-binding MarR family transcriptional regulator